MRIFVQTPGFLTSVQDLGRYGHAHLGVSPCGAADGFSLRVANRLVGNADNTPALEMTLVGPKLAFEEDCTIALAGARSAAVGLRAFGAHQITGGETIDFGPLIGGARSYLAVAGGISVPSVLGSGSTHLQATFGGYKGRALQKGDEIQVGTAERRPISPPVTSLNGLFNFAGVIRVTCSTQWDWFDDSSRERFFNSEYVVTEQSNRNGLRLTGEAISAANRSELLTEGVSIGAIQIPRDGHPIILFVDQQTTGGYPKIANVISADLHHIGQLRPRDAIRFQLVSIDDALNALREQHRMLNEALPI